MNESTQITNNKSKLLEPELSYKIQGAVFNVINKYGKGLKEKIYQKALSEEFIKQGLQIENHSLPCFVGRFVIRENSFHIRANSFL